MFFSPRRRPACGFQFGHSFSACRVAVMARASHSLSPRFSGCRNRQCNQRVCRLAVYGDGQTLHVCDFPSFYDPPPEPVQLLGDDACPINGPQQAPCAGIGQEAEQFIVWQTDRQLSLHRSTSPHRRSTPRRDLKHVIASAHRTRPAHSRSAADSARRPRGLEDTRRVAEGVAGGDGTDRASTERSENAFQLQAAGADPGGTSTRFVTRSESAGRSCGPAP